VSLRNAVELSHYCVKMVVRPDDTVIDATCGNGHDTLFLARLVPEGRVLAFDISPLAINNTAARLEEHGVSERVELFQEDFRNLRDYVKSPVAAIMFNLGYLPGASRETATKAEHSRQAVERAVKLVRPGGVVTVVCYRGHQGGPEETSEIFAVTAGLSQKEFKVLKIDFLNQVNNPPLLVAVYRLEGDRA